MPVVRFTSHLRSLLSRPEYAVDGDSLHDVFEAVFHECPQARSYLLDDQGALRKHVAVFVDGSSVSDRQSLSDRLDRNAEVYVMQALSGG